MPGQIEQRVVGDLGMYHRLLGNEKYAFHFSLLADKRSYALPELGKGGSMNFCPTLRAARGDWDGLEEFFKMYRDYSWQLEEFNSPLYTARVFVACVLGAEFKPYIREVLRQWIALLSIQSTMIKKKRKELAFDWGGVETTIPHRQCAGLYLPPTGVRANGASIADPLVAPLLAVILGLPCRQLNAHRFRPENVPTNIDQMKTSGDSNLIQPNGFTYALQSMVRSVEQAGATLNKLGLSHRLLDACRKVIYDGQESSIKYLHSVLNNSTSSHFHEFEMNVHPRLGLFLVERNLKTNDVLTAVFGSSTIQKCTVAAGRTMAAGDDTRIVVAAPSANRGERKIATRVTGKLDFNHATFSGDVSAEIRRLPRPKSVFRMSPVGQIQHEFEA